MLSEADLQRRHETQLAVDAEKKWWDSLSDAQRFVMSDLYHRALQLHASGFCKTIEDAQRVTADAAKLWIKRITPVAVVGEAPKAP